MKIIRRLILIQILLISGYIYGQNFNKKLFFNEFLISANRTVQLNENSINYNGFGIGINKSFMDSSWFNLVTGLSYDKTTQLRKYIYTGNGSYLSNITYNMNCISVPILLRFKTGKSTVFFAETGFNIEFHIASNRKGTLVSDSYGIENGRNVINEKSNFLSSSSGLIFNIGTIIPFNNSSAFILKFGYQFGITDFGESEVSVFNRYAKLSVGIRIGK